MAALATVLSRIGGIDKYDRPASVFSFALESLLEVSPTCVQDAFGEVPLHHAIDRQILKGDIAESGDQRASQLVQKVLSLISDVFRESSQRRDGFTAVRSTQLSPRRATLEDTELALGSAIPSRVFDVLAVGEGEKTVQSGVDTNFFCRCRQRLRPDFAREGRVPFPGLAADAQRLNLALQFPVPAHSYPTNAGQAQTSAINREPVPFLLESERAKAVSSLKAGIPRCLSRPDTAKECLKRLVEIGDNDLKNVTVNADGEGIVGLVNLDAAKLFHLADRSAFCLVCRFSLAQAIIIETAACLKSRFQPFTLGMCWVQAVTKSFEHSDSLLCLDVPLNGLGRHIAGSTGEIAPGPHGRQPEQLFVLLAKVERGYTFAFLDDICGAVAGPDTNEQVYVVRLDGQLKDGPTLLAAFLREPMPAVFSDVSGEDRFSPLRTPNEVINDQMDPVFIALIFHVGSIRTDDKEINKRKERLKPKSPNRSH